MKERLQHLLSEAGESFDYLRSDIRNLSRSMAELEEFIERYRTFAANATLSTPTDREEIRKLAARKRTKLLGHHPANNQRDLAQMIRRRAVPRFSMSRRWGRW